MKSGSASFFKALLQTSCGFMIYIPKSYIYIYILYQIRNKDLRLSLRNGKGSRAASHRAAREHEGVIREQRGSKRE